jgi:hypothetical protein
MALKPINSLVRFMLRASVPSVVGLSLVLLQGFRLCAAPNWKKDLDARLEAAFPLSSSRSLGEGLATSAKPVRYWSSANPASRQRLVRRRQGEHPARRQVHEVKRVNEVHREILRAWRCRLRARDNDQGQLGLFANSSTTRRRLDGACSPMRSVAGRAWVDNRVYSGCPNGNGGVR